MDFSCSFKGGFISCYEECFCKFLFKGVYLETPGSYFKIARGVILKMRYIKTDRYFKLFHLFELAQEYHSNALI